MHSLGWTQHSRRCREHQRVSLKEADRLSKPHDGVIATGWLKDTLIMINSVRAEYLQHNRHRTTLLFIQDTSARSSRTYSPLVWWVALLDCLLNSSH